MECGTPSCGLLFQRNEVRAAQASARSELPIPAPLEDLVVSLERAWTVERAERWWAIHRPLPADARRVAEVLLSQEGRELRIGPWVRPKG
jgi:hypothetical protein